MLLLDMYSSFITILSVYGSFQTSILDAKNHVLTPPERSCSVFGRNTSSKVGGSYVDHRIVLLANSGQLSSWVRPDKPAGQTVTLGFGVFGVYVTGLLNTVWKLANNAGKA